MSELLTLGVMKDLYQDKLPAHCNITGSEFTDLLNRAAERLYNRSAQHGMVKEVVVVPANNLIDVSVNEYCHVKAFRIDDNAALRIIPVEDTWKPDKAGFGAFVDMGYSDTDYSIRQYRLPEQYQDEDLTDYTFKMLAKKKYQKVKDSGDYIAINSKEALKNAMFAILHEEASDPDTAAKYWSLTDGSATLQDQQFRGPVVPTISFHDQGLSDNLGRIV